MSLAMLLLEIVGRTALAASAGLIFGVDSVSSFSLNNSYPVTLDPSGAIYALGQGTVPNTSSVRKFTTSGTVYAAPLDFLAGTLRADAAGNVYVTGLLPASIVAKLNPAGTQLLYRVQFGDKATVTDLAIDATGDVYVCGMAPGGELSTTGNAFQRSAVSGKYHPFAAKLNRSGSIIWATYVAGGDSGNAYRIGIDGTGAVVLLGSTSARDFPTTPGAMRTTAPTNPPGVEQVFLAKLKPDGSGLLYSTYMEPRGYSINSRTPFVIDSAGSAWIVHPAENARFSKIVRIHAQGTGQVFARTIPVAADELRAASDAQGDIYLTGNSRYFANMPLRNNLAACPNDNAFFLMVLDSTGNIRLSTYLPLHGYPQAVAVPRPGSVSIAAAREQTVELFQLSARSEISVLPLACSGNAASLFKGPIAPGELVSLFGEGLGPEEGITVEAEGFTYPSEAGGMSVTFNGKPGPLLYLQHGQVNAVAPWSLNGAAVEICVLREGARLGCLTQPVSESEAGVFIHEDDYAIAWNEDGRRNSPENPAELNSIVTVLATGVGPFDREPADGEILRSPVPGLLLAPYFFYRMGGVIGSYIRLAAIDAAPLSEAVAGIVQVRFRARPDTLSLAMANSNRLSRGFRIHIRP